MMANRRVKPDLQPTGVSVKILTLRLLVLLCSCGCAGCGSYRPPIIPVEVTVDRQGRISVSVNRSFVTPIGTFTVGSELNSNKSTKEVTHLIVQLNEQRTVFPLEGKEFDVQLASGYYEKVTLRKTGSHIILELKRSEAGPARSPQEASALVGEYCTVEMRILAVHLDRKSGVLFLNSEASYKNPANFTIMVTSEVAKELMKKGPPLVRLLKYKKIRVSGVVINYQGRPEIIVEMLDQFHNLDRLKS